MQYTAFIFRTVLTIEIKEPAASSSFRYTKQAIVNLVWLCCLILSWSESQFHAMRQSFICKLNKNRAILHLFLDQTWIINSMSARLEHIVVIILSLPQLALKMQALKLFVFHHQQKNLWINEYSLSRLLLCIFTLHPWLTRECLPTGQGVGGGS